MSNSKKSSKFTKSTKSKSTKVYYTIKNACVTGFSYNKLLVSVFNTSELLDKVSKFTGSSPLNGNILKLTIPKAQMDRYKNVSVKDRYDFDVSIDKYEFDGKTGWYAMINGMSFPQKDDSSDDSSDDEPEDSSDNEPESTEIKTKK